MITGSAGRALGRHAGLPHLGGVRSASDALAFVHGDQARDGLGWRVLPVDPDRDGTSDLISCENDGDLGICWLLPGATFTP